MVISPIFFRKMMVILLITIILVLHGQAMASELNAYQRGSASVAMIKYPSICDIFSPLRTAPTANSRSK